METKIKIKPFLKWAGGKRWLLPEIESLFKQNKYRLVEPFLGGGSVLFGLQPDRALVNDVNKELIETYCAVRDNYVAVIRLLKMHANRHSDSYYYKVRSSDPVGRYAKAAKFIYLNRTCFNGIYRVNLKGKFNVPRGTKNTVFLPDDCWESSSLFLKRVELLNVDFEEIVNQAGAGDFLYLDPPYTVKHNLNGFVKYNEKIFSWDDQTRLEKSAASAANRGAVVVVSNAFHQSIRKLYSHAKWKFLSVSRSSSIGSKNEYRSQTSEALIVRGGNTGTKKSMVRLVNGTRAVFRDPESSPGIRYKG